MGCGATVQRSDVQTKSPEEPKQGATSSTKKAANASGLGDESPPILKGKQRPGELLAKYQLGQVLGQGAFGIVYECTQKETGGTFAVKMIDLVESPLDSIKREVRLMMKLKHPTIVCLHQVFFEKVFVCMVMDLYKGGDLIIGMQAHWKNKGVIPPLANVHICRQMVQSIVWLHSQGVIHRDVKGDNFLMDRPDLSDPDCGVFLSDFGTVIEVKPGDRLQKPAGTHIYWSPEVFLKDYGLKMDVWSIGVIVHCIVKSRFPFKDEHDVLFKELSLGRDLPSSLKDFQQKLLKKKEEQRPSATEALEHAWLRADKGTAEPTPGSPKAEEDDGGDTQEVADGTSSAEIQEEGANAGIDERRRELVARLAEAATRAATGALGYLALRALLAGSFSVYDHAKERKMRYEWMPEKKVFEEGILDLSAAKDVANIDEVAEHTGRNVGQVLEEHGIDTGLFGKNQAKTLEEFASEVRSGAARLMLDATKHKTIVRVVDIVLLRISHGEGDKRRYLVKTAEQYADGRTRGMAVIPGTKKEPHENSTQVVERLVQDRLKVSDLQPTISLEDRQRFEDEEESPSYPGVRTVYKKEIVCCEVTTTDPDVLFRFGITSSGEFTSVDDKNMVRTYAWLTEAECKERQVQIHAPEEETVVSALVQAPIGLDVKDLSQWLQIKNIDVTKFGKPPAKTLKELSQELVKGEASLFEQADGSILRVVDVVCMFLQRPDTGDILVEASTEADGTAREKRLPALKRRPDEHQFIVAHEVLERLRIEENHVRFNADNVQVIEESRNSMSYPGLHTYYRKRLVRGALTVLPAGQA